MVGKHERQHKSDTTEILLEPMIRHESPNPPLLGQTVHLPQGWPTSPKLIKSSVASIVLDFVVDVLLLVLTLTFFAFGLVVKHYDQAPIVSHQRTTDTLLSATKYGPTVFPILFACVLGRAAHAILVWRLEKGEYVGILDLLAGSTSLTSTVTSQLKLRMISIVGLALIAIWSLSPIGGQASFRQMSIGSNISVELSPFTYMVNSGSMDQFDNSDRMVYWGIVNTLFVASIITPAVTKSSPRDLWGNVKIPMIENYENTSNADRNGWFVTDGGDESAYSSVVGLPISGTNSSEFIDYAMNVEAAYLFLDCPVVSSSWSSIPTDAVNVTGDGAYIWWFDNTTQRALTAQTDVNDLAPFNFRIIDWGTGGESQCTITTTYIEVEISCPTSSTCAASRIRRSQLKHPSPSYTQLDLPSYGDYGNWYLFASNFVSSVSGHPNTPTIVQTYLVDPDNPAGLLTGGLEDSALLTSKELYVIRLNQLLNAYWTCINGLFVIAGGMTQEKAYTGNNFSAEVGILPKASTTNGTRSTQTLIIECHEGWVTVLCIASTVMVIASLVRPVIWYFFMQAPDLMLNISNLATRNNPYMSLPTTGTFMTGSDRARLLKNLKVQFGDVDANADIGNLAIRSVNTSGAQKNANVRKGRLYV